MLLFDGVVYNYSNQPVFSDLNFELNEGEFSFLIGKSGAGKTTLMQLVYMNLFPQEGNVKVGEFNSKTIKEKEIPLLRRKLGIIFQDFKLLSDRNVYENLAFVLRVTGTPKKLIKRKVFHALSDVGLSNKQNNMPDELSGGEKQRVAIARAIINDPMLILADEPTGNLDPETSSEILDILIKVNQRGTTLLLATHNYDLVKKIDAKIIKISDGKAVKVKLKR